MYVYAVSKGKNWLYNDFQRDLSLRQVFTFDYMGSEHIYMIVMVIHIKYDVYLNLSFYYTHGSWDRQTDRQSKKLSSILDVVREITILDSMEKFMLTGNSFRTK